MDEKPSLRYPRVRQMSSFEDSHEAIAGVPENVPLMRTAVGETWWFWRTKLRASSKARVLGTEIVHRKAHGNQRRARLPSFGRFLNCLRNVLVRRPFDRPLRTDNGPRANLVPTAITCRFHCEILAGPAHCQGMFVFVSPSP